MVLSWELLVLVPIGEDGETVLSSCHSTMHECSVGLLFCRNARKIPKTFKSLVMPALPDDLAL